MIIRKMFKLIFNSFFLYLIISLKVIAAEDFDQWLKLNSFVLRHMTVSLDQRPKEHTEKSAVTENPKTENTESLSKNDETKIESDVEESLDSEDIQKDKEA